jgi:hypothetical protein
MVAEGHVETQVLEYKNILELQLVHKIADVQIKHGDEQAKQVVPLL